MKANRKVIGWVLGGLFLIFITTAIMTFCIERYFYRQQLNRSARNVAISLSLSLSQPLYNGDRVLLNNLLTTVFNQEALELLEVRTSQGALMASRSKMVKSQSAPTWFLNLTEWPALTKQVNVVYNQQVVGELLVSSDPSFAFDALWNSTVVLSLCFLFWSVLFSIGAFFGVAHLFAPLSHITQHLQALGRRQFIIEKKLPHLLEFNRLTLVVNETVLSLKKIFQAQLTSIESVRYQLFRDDLTGFGNRRYFLYQLSSLLCRDLDYVPGFVLGISIDEYDEFKNQTEERQRSEFIRDIANFCAEFWFNYPDMMIARYDEAYLILVIQENDVELLSKQCEAFNQKLQQMVAKRSVCKILLGLVSYDAFHDKTMLINELEQTLHRARTEPFQLAISPHLEAHKQYDISMEELESSLSQENEYIDQQSVTDGEKIYHQAVVLKLPVKDGFIYSDHLMPMIRRAGVARKLDLFVLDLVCQKELPNSEFVAFTLCDVTLSDDAILQTYLKRLKVLPLNYRRHLNVEVTEHTMLHHYSQVVAFFNALDEIDINLGIKQVGISYTSMNYLYEVPLSYIKIHGSLSHEEDKDKDFVLRYLVELTNSQRIQLIATEVNSEREWQTLQHFGVQWGTGKYFTDMTGGS